MRGFDRNSTNERFGLDRLSGLDEVETHVAESVPDSEALTSVRNANVSLGQTDYVSCFGKSWLWLRLDATASFTRFFCFQKFCPQHLFLRRSDLVIQDLSKHLEHVADSTQLAFVPGQAL